MRSYLDFETPVADIDARIDELRALAAKAIRRRSLRKSQAGARSAKALTDLYVALTPWQKTQVARVQGARTSTITSKA